MNASRTIRILGSLARKLGKTALVILLLLAFSQWYLPSRGYKLASQVSEDQDSNVHRLLYEDCLFTRESIFDNPRERTRGIMQENGMRLSRPIPSRERPHHVLIVGDSITFGLGVDDTQTYPWLLNEMFPDCAFDNAAMLGYGPVLSYYAMKEYLPQRHYDMVLYAGIFAHFKRDALWRARERGWFDPTDLVYVQPYCTLMAPLPGETRPRLDMHPGGCIVWPGDRSLYLVNFLKLFTARELAINAEILRPRNKYARFLGDEALEAQRLRLLLDKMEGYARAQEASFGLVGFEQLCAALEKHQVIPSPKHPESQTAWPASFPILDASYPIDFHQQRELCTEKTYVDEGNHPGPQVHAYYAQRIAVWLAQPEVAGKWIGRYIPKQLDTGEEFYRSDSAKSR